MNKDDATLYDIDGTKSTASLEPVVDENSPEYKALVGDNSIPAVQTEINIPGDDSQPAAQNETNIPGDDSQPAVQTDTVFPGDDSQPTVQTDMSIPCDDTTSVPTHEGKQIDDKSDVSAPTHEEKHLQTNTTDATQDQTPKGCLASFEALIMKDGMPRDSGFRWFFWFSWVSVLISIIILIFAIIWVAVCKGTTFGAYSILDFIAFPILAGISALNLFFLYRHPNRVFYHGVLVLVTFFVFIALLAFAVALGIFHLFTINLESAIFKMDFYYYEEKLKLTTEQKIKGVDDGSFWMAFCLGLFSAIILITMFVFATILCVKYVRCHYFMALFCSVQPFLVGAFGIVFAIGLGSVSAMTQSHYSFIYNAQGWTLFVTGIIDLIASFILLAVFFGCSCKVANNTINFEDTYPGPDDVQYGEEFPLPVSDGTDPNSSAPEPAKAKIRHRADGLGRDYWHCQREMCLFMWMNVLVCTPVFIVILVTVVVGGYPSHSDPLPCTASQFIDRISNSPSSFVALSSLPPVSLIGQGYNNSNGFSSSSSSSSSPPPLLGQVFDGSECNPMLGSFGCEAPAGRNFPGWASLSGNCLDWTKSAADYSLGLNEISRSDYSQCSGKYSLGKEEVGVAAAGGGGEAARRRSIWHRMAVWLTTPSKVHKRESNTGRTRTSSTSTIISTPTFSFSSSSSFSPLTQSLAEMLMTEYDDVQRVKKMEEAEVVALAAEEGTHLSASSPAVFSNQDLLDCYDYTTLIYEWKEDIETYGTLMTLITGIAMLIPATPIVIVDGIFGGILFGIWLAILAWLGLLFGYYILQIILHCCCQSYVVDRTEVHGNTITEYYHIEDHAPGFNCCICCGIYGCFVFIRGFASCVIMMCVGFCTMDRCCCCDCEGCD